MRRRSSHEGQALVSESDPITTAAATRPRRRARRDSLFLSATVRRKADPEDEIVLVRVRNLSAVGLMADYDDVAEIGDEVVVKVRGIGSIDGRIAWLRRGRVGIAFDVEVDPKLVRRPVKAAGRPPRPTY
jgi:hypothetical protein